MKEVIATCSLILLNNIGLIMLLNFHGVLKVIGYFDWISTIIILYIVLLAYFDSKFYKNLKYPWETQIISKNYEEEPETIEERKTEVLP